MVIVACTLFFHVIYICKHYPDAITLSQGNYAFYKKIPLNTTRALSPQIN